MHRPEILLVDDDDLFREIAEDALRRALPDARVKAVANGKQAIEILEHGLPTVLVTDLRMPILDGFGVLLFLAKRKAAVSIVVMSAFLTPDMERRANSAGALQCIEKPVDLAVLIRAVKGLISAKNTGHMAGVSLPGFVQLLQMEKQNCTIRVESLDRYGLLHFTGGEITDAWDGECSGDTAAIGILAWRNVTMDIVKPRISDRHTVQQSASFLIMEAFRIMDEEATESKAKQEQTKAARAPHSAKSFLNLYINQDTELELPAVPAAPALPTGLGVSGIPGQTGVPVTAATPALSAAQDFPAATQLQQQEKRSYNMAGISESLDAVMAIDGCIGAALCDWTSGLNLGTVGGGSRLNIENAGALNCGVVKAKINAMNTLGINGGIEDILITLDDQYHLIRPLKKNPSLFIYVALDRAKSNLGVSRMKLQQVEKGLSI